MLKHQQMEINNNDIFVSFLSYWLTLSWYYYFFNEIFSFIYTNIDFERNKTYFVLFYVLLFEHM